MAWNPSPQVAVARDYAKKFGKSQVVILAIDEHNNLSYASYGATKQLCGSAEKIADIALDSIMSWFQGGYVDCR